MANLDRVLGTNVHVQISAQAGTVDAGVTRLMPLIKGYIDDFQAAYAGKLATFTPLGEPNEHDQPMPGSWTITLTGGDRNAMMMAISRDQEARIGRRESIPKLTVTATGFDPSNGAEAWQFSWSDGTLSTADLRSQGQDKDVVHSGTIKCNKIA